MKTLREQLNAKVKKESAEALREEIKEIFLNAKFQDLRWGMSIRLCFDGNGTLHHFSGNGYKPFKENYDKDTLRAVIPLMEEEGLEASDDLETEGGVSITYNPLIDQN